MLEEERRIVGAVIAELLERGGERICGTWVPARISPAVVRTTNPGSRPVTSTPVLIAAPRSTARSA